MNIKHLSSFFKIRKMGVVGACILAAACSQNSTLDSADNDKKLATEGISAKDDLYVVDCSLPGVVKKLGNMQYVGPRRPLKTTASDCSIRGGEYVAYDRADYRSALNVWLPQAEAGDKVAQNYVGEIFEKGVGSSPDYDSAAAWYAKAAANGNSRAQVNLAYLYEKGLGVPKNMTIALNWYRKASGIQGDDLMLSSDATKAIEDTRNAAQKALAKTETQVRFLRKQLTKLQQEVSAAERASEQFAQTQEIPPSEAEQELIALTEMYQKAEGERDQLKTELASLELTYRKMNAGEALTPEKLKGSDARKLKDISFGRYFALIIGNQNYAFLDDLRSPIRDTKRLQSVLENKYGFTTLRVENATEKEILNTINNFYSQIGEDDNLLIYYAGHGEISRGGQSQKERGYWLPREAQAENISSWINNAVISDHLDRLKARSVMVIADSCYAGYLGSEKSPFLFGLSGRDSEAVIRSSISRRSRVVISSGGTKPVLDGTNQMHSIFAGALLDTLENNTDVLKGSHLFSQLTVNLRKRGESIDIDQAPEMKPVREAGHEGGSFYFVPMAL